MTPELPLVTKVATCTKCGAEKRPTKKYLALLKYTKLPYICKACRESGPLPPMSLGKLGWM